MSTRSLIQKEGSMMESWLAIEIAEMLKQSNDILERIAICLENLERRT